MKKGGWQGEGENRKEKRELELVPPRGRGTQRGKKENSWGLWGVVGSLGQELPLIGNTKPTNTSKL